MSAKSQVIGQLKGTSGLMRPRFAPGQLLRDDDLTQGVNYTRELSRLLFKTLLGCGVMCGLIVKWKYQCDKLNILIADGVALDCHGDPIQVPAPQTVTIDFHCTGQEVPPFLYILLRGCGKCCAPRDAVCGSGDGDGTSQCTREVDGFEIRVVGERPKCVCGCPEPNDDESHLLRTHCRCADPSPDWCYGAHYQGLCGCNCANCSDCDCEWILLARLEYNENSEQPAWKVDHRVRRFIRPVLMSDPQVELEHPKQENQANAEEAGGAAHAATHAAAHPAEPAVAAKAALRGGGGPRRHPPAAPVSRRT
jgi:hypothetical protein